jgi:hypothetical protein
MWRQGEHVVIVGMTGSGKTTLASELLQRRGHVVALITKPDDLSWRGWRTVSTTDKIIAHKHDKWRLAPDFERQDAQFNAMFIKAWRETRWCIYIDETYHIVKNRHNERQLIKLLTQGRSNKITVVCGVQRPSWVPREIFSEATHVFSFLCGDRRDLKALSEGISEELADKVRDLPKYHFAYYNKWDRTVREGTIKTLDQILD